MNETLVCELQKHHIWPVWVGSLLGQSISGVQHVMFNTIEGLSMENCQNVNNSGQGGQKYKIFTCERNLGFGD